MGTVTRLVPADRVLYEGEASIHLNAAYASKLPDGTVVLLMAGTRGIIVRHMVDCGDLTVTLNGEAWPVKKEVRGEETWEFDTRTLTRSGCSEDGVAAELVVHMDAIRSKGQKVLVVSDKWFITHNYAA